MDLPGFPYLGCPCQPAELLASLINTLVLSNRRTQTVWIMNRKRGKYAKMLKMFR